MQIKREPCQVSEVTTTNFTATNSSSALTAVVKIEHEHSSAAAARTSASVIYPQHQQQRTSAVLHQSSSSSSSSSVAAAAAALRHHHQMSIMDGNTVTSGQTNAIPVGIAVARQRLQETTAHTPALKTSDINRFGIGLGDLGRWIKYTFLI